MRKGTPVEEAPGEQEVGCPLPVKPAIDGCPKEDRERSPKGASWGEDQAGALWRHAPQTSTASSAWVPAIACGRRAMRRPPTSNSPTSPADEEEGVICFLNPSRHSLAVEHDNQQNQDTEEVAKPGDGFDHCTEPRSSRPSIIQSTVRRVTTAVTHRSPVLTLTRRFESRRHLHEKRITPYATH